METIAMGSGCANCSHPLDWFPPSLSPCLAYHHAYHELCFIAKSSFKQISTLRGKLWKLFSSNYSGRSQHIALLVFNFSRHEEPGAQLHNFKLRNHCTSMGPIYLYCHNPDQTSGLQCQLYKILKHRHRQNVTSHHFFSLLWLF